MFDLNQLRSFIAVATELNFRRAASRLNMTQPPLTRQIQLLEHQLGVLLLERTKRLVRLTPAGRAFLPEAESLLQRAQIAALAARRVARGDAGAVAIGFVGGASYALLPRIVNAARVQLPDVDLILKEMNTFEELEALASRRIDAGIIRPIVERRAFEARCVVSEPFILAMPSNHSLTRKRGLSLSMLDGEPVIMYSPSDWQPFYELLAGGVPISRRRAEVHPVPRVDADDPHAREQRDGRRARPGIREHSPVRQGRLQADQTRPRGSCGTSPRVAQGRTTIPRSRPCATSSFASRVSSDGQGTVARDLQAPVFHRMDGLVIRSVCGTLVSAGTRPQAHGGRISDGAGRTSW